MIYFRNSMLIYCDCVYNRRLWNIE